MDSRLTLNLNLCTDLLAQSVKLGMIVAASSVNCDVEFYPFCRCLSVPMAGKLRVATCLENVEILGNLTDVGNDYGDWLIVGKSPWKISLRELFIVHFTSAGALTV